MHHFVHRREFLHARNLRMGGAEQDWFGTGIGVERLGAQHKHHVVPALLSYFVIVENARRALVVRAVGEGKRT